jgi:ArsR family transcriptional regulator
MNSLTLEQGEIMVVNMEIIKRQSDICKTFSNPYRMHIVKLLCSKEMSAAELLSETGLSKANLSQHMAVLVGKGTVNSTRMGVKIHYSLADKKIVQACSLMQEFVVGMIRKDNKMLSKI